MKFYQDPFWQGCAIVALVIVAFGTAGTSDIEEAQRQEQEYCDNVAAKVWPDYNGNFSSVCLKGNPVKTGYTVPPNLSNRVVRGTNRLRPLAFLTKANRYA